MSGGHFDYGCFRISQFAEELRHELDLNDCTEKNSYGDEIGQHFESETIDNLKRSLEIIELAGKLAYEIEWLYSGDHGEDSFNKIIKNIFNKE